MWYLWVQYHTRLSRMIWSRLFGGEKTKKSDRVCDLKRSVPFHWHYCNAPNMSLRNSKRKIRRFFHVDRKESMGSTLRDQLLRVGHMNVALGLRFTRDINNIITLSQLSWSLTLFRFTSYFYLKVQPRCPCLCPCYTASLYVLHAITTCTRLAKPLRRFMPTQILILTIF